MKRLLAGAEAFGFDRRFVLFSLAASLALHALVAHRLFSKHQTKPPPREELVVELVGMVSHRQVEQKQQGDVRPDPAPIAPPAPPPPKVAKKPAKKPMPRPEKPKPEPKKPQPEEQTAQAAPPPREQAKPQGAEEQQVQQTITPRISEASLIREYLTGLRREIQRHLDYPQEARDTGYIGVPTIRFTITETGAILPGSLAISKSSGSEQLDERALRAARSSAPMAKPPRQMTVTITVAFTQDG